MIKKLLQSRQFWGLVVQFLFNGLVAIQPEITNETATLAINVLLTGLNIYLRAYPKVQF